MFFYACDISEVRHCRIKAQISSSDIGFSAAKWLSHHCGFFPQIWLSRRQDKLSGYNPYAKPKVLFGFNKMYGFPVKYDEWQQILGILLNTRWGGKQFLDRRIDTDLSWMSTNDPNVTELLNGYGNLEKFLKRFKRGLGCIQDQYIQSTEFFVYIGEEFLYRVLL